MQQVIIIGAGLGGLFTAALLAKEGFRVTVLEKNATIGGGLQNFSRFGLEPSDNPHSSHCRSRKSHSAAWGCVACFRIQRYAPGNSDYEYLS